MGGRDHKNGVTQKDPRIASAMEEEWKPFRNSPDKSDRKIFNQMFSGSPGIMYLSFLQIGQASFIAS